MAKHHWARSRWFSVLCSLLVIVGVGLLIAPTVYTRVVQTRYRETVATYKQRATSTSGQTHTLRRYNHSLAVHTPTKLPLSKSQLARSIGYVSIPRIHVTNQPIYYGDDDATLARGVGVLPGTSLPIGGKSTLSVISGHSGFNNQIIFDNIRHLKNGDRFYITALGQKRHAYRVYKRLVIDPTSKNAKAPVQAQPGRDITILLTCTPVFINSHRLLIFGKRVPLQKRPDVAPVRTPKRQNKTATAVAYLLTVLMLAF